MNIDLYLSREVCWDLVDPLPEQVNVWGFEIGFTLAWVFPLDPLPEQVCVHVEIWLPLYLSRCVYMWRFGCPFT